MEGVGARLGRSSTRYGGPATVFTGSVRKWKKRWVPLSNPNSNNNHNSSNNNHNSSNNHSSNNNGNNNNNPSHLLIYKWTPISKDSSSAPVEEPPRKKFRYVPVAVIGEQKQEEAAAVKSDDEGNPAEDEAAAAEPTQTDGSDAKPEVNEVKEEATEAVNKGGASAEEINETNLDLNLGLKTRNGDNGSDPKTGEGEGSDQLERRPR